MTVIPFKTVDGGASDVPPPNYYTVVHTVNGSIMETAIVGYSMTTETLLFIADEQMIVRFMLPLSNLVYLTAQQVEHAPQAHEIN